MKKIVNFLLLSLLMIGFFESALANQVYINHIKEPKLVFDEPKKETKFELQNKQPITDNTPKESLIQKIEVVNQPPKEVIKNESPKIVEPKQTPQEIVIKTKNEEIEQKKNIEPIQKENIEVKVEAPKTIITNTKNSKNEPIALVFASGTIGKYAIDSSNIAMTYLVNKNVKFQLETIDIGLETKENIAKALDTLSEKKIKKVILLLTNNSMWGLNSYLDIAKFDIYLPLIHKSTVANPKPNYIFGGMDYQKQFKFLTSKATSHIVEIYDESTISKNLHDELVKLNIPDIKYLQLVGKNLNYNPLFLKSNKIKNATVILNTSIVKSAIILALLRGNDVNPKETFATQLNYSPLIFNLTQEEDRNNLFVVNSIEFLPRDTEELISFFGEDVLFNWVNYSVVLGLEYFISNNKKLFGNIEIKENQVNYPVKLFGFEGTKFRETKR